MDALLRLLMGPWTSNVLWALRQHGPLRFGTIRRTVQGISAKVLTERLRMLEKAGVIFREYRPRIPPEVTYGLTPRGRQLGPILDAMDALAQRWSAEDGRAGSAEEDSRAHSRAPLRTAADKRRASRAAG
jgi:DNA-binding HxlR family transcriptional regulator